MTIGYNSSVDLKRSAVLSEVWFGKGFGSQLYQTYNVFYKIEWTEAGKYPVFRDLIQYNRYNPGDIKEPDWDNLPETIGAPISPSGWIGEYFSSPDISISKFVFPKFLAEHGYTTAVIFDNTPSDPKWLDRNLDGGEWWKTKFGSDWRYKISLDRSYTSTDETTGQQAYHELDYDIIGGKFIVKTDFIVQFMTTEDTDNDSDLNLDSSFIKVHNSNYTNPHSTQISSIATQDLDGHIMSTERANQVITLPNSFMIGSFMVSNDFSFRFMGEQLYLPRPTAIKLEWYIYQDKYVHKEAPEEIKRSETYFVSAVVYPIQEYTTGKYRSVARDIRISPELIGGPQGTELILIPYENSGIENLYKIIIPNANNDHNLYDMELTMTVTLYDDISTNYSFISTDATGEGASSQGGQNGG